MFESANAIREAQKLKMLERERKRIRKVLEKHGVVLSPEVVEAVFGNNREDSQ